MRKPNNKFQYRIINRLGVLQTEPLGESDFMIEWTREDEGRLDYKNELPSKIIFTGQAYANLLKLEQSIYRCDFVTIEVDRHCFANGAGFFTLWFSGRMSLNDGTWDLDRCIVEIKLDDVKEEQCYEDNKSRELNLFSYIFSRRTVFLNPTNLTIETITYTSGEVPENSGQCQQYYWGGSDDPNLGAWSVYDYVYTLDRSLTTGPGDPGVCTMQTSWARETLTLPCGSPSPGPEWVLVTDGCPSGDRIYARQIRVYGCTTNTPNYSDPIQVTTFHCNIVGDSSTVSIDNGMTLTDVINLFMSIFCTGFAFVSNFFQINPDIPSSINYVTGQRSKTRFLTLYQKSDVKRPTAINNATKATLSFEKLIEFLVEMFNVRWRVEANTIRMEHVSYFSRLQGFDLTQPKWAKYIKGKRKYTYANQEIPARETYKFMEAGYGDFQGLDIVYSGGCVSGGSRNNIKNHAVDKVTTDIELVLSNPDADSKVVTDDGFVLVAADFDGANYYIITETSILGGSSINNSLAWAQLHRDYHKWDRPLSRGNMNGLDTAFFSTKPTKKGEKITIPLCCSNTFSPDDIVKTPLGTGIVDKATYSFKDETLELEILYPADQGLTTNTAPIANNDVVIAYQDTQVNINILGNDIDPDLGSQITSAQIMLAPTHGTAVLLANNTIQYTPAPGYVGDDYVVYRILDDWSQPSNNALVAITVRAPNTAPVAINDSYIGTKNTALNIPSNLGLFLNDSDDVAFTLDTFDAISVNGGIVVVNSDGSFIYTPATGFVGFDTFTYTIKDTPGLTDTATVTIEVRDPNNPVAVNDGPYVTTRNQNISIAAPGVLDNDTTGVGSLTAVAGTFPTAQGGSFIVATNGSFTYAPPTNYTGLDSVTYTASNGSGTAIATVAFRVIPDVYVKLQQVDNFSESITQDCVSQGFPDTGDPYPAGDSSTATFRVFFYSDSGGVNPLNVTGFGVIVNFRVMRANISGGTTTVDYTQAGNSTQIDLFNGPQQYYHNQFNCSGTTTSYWNDSFTLRPGLYTII